MNVRKYLHALIPLIRCDRTLQGTFFPHLVDTCIGCCHTCPDHTPVVFPLPQPLLDFSDKNPPAPFFFFEIGL